jgi:hypothetical protein
MKGLVWATFLLGAIISFSGCKSVTNLDSDPAFKQMIGKNYKTMMDMAVIKYKDDPENFVLGIPGTQDVPSIKKMPKEFPFDYYNQTTYGILPAGSNFRISHIERVATIEFSFVDIYATVTSEGMFKDYIIEVGGPTDQTKKVPTFDEKYIEELPPVN